MNLHHFTANAEVELSHVVTHKKHFGERNYMRQNQHSRLRTANIKEFLRLRERHKGKDIQ